jgi:hypothetical protein
MTTSRDSNTPEGLESRFSVRIHRIPAELSHLTELELKKLCRSRMDSSRTSALKLLGGLPTSWEVLRPSEPLLSLSILQEWTWEHHRGLNLTFFTLSAGRSKRVFIGGLSRRLGQSLGSGGPHVKLASHLTWSGDQALWQHRLSHIGYPSCRLKLTHVEIDFKKMPNPGWPHLVSVGPGLFATSSPCVTW